MSPSITFSGVDNAISNLNYRNKKALKYKFVKAVRGFYSEEAQFDSISQIEVDELIGLIWETEDPKEIRSKRINFNSIKAAVNTDFKKIYDKGLNFEGLTISPSNTFEMSAEAKDQLLESFVNSIRADGKLDFHKVSQVLNMINAFLESATTSIQEQDTDEVINKIQSILNNISTKVVDTKDGQPILAEDERLIIRPDELIDDEFEYLEDESDENEFDFEGVEDEPEEDDLEFMDSEEDEDEFEIDDEDEFEDLLDEELDFIDEEDEFEDEEIDDDEYEEIEIGEDELEADDEIISEVDDEDELDFVDDEEDFEFEEDEIDDEDFEEFEIDEDDEEFDFIDDEDEDDDEEFEEEDIEDEDYEDIEYEDDFELDEELDFVDEDEDIDDEFEEDEIDDDEFEDIEYEDEDDYDVTEEEDEELEFLDEEEDDEFEDEEIEDEEFEDIEYEDAEDFDVTEEEEESEEEEDLDFLDEDDDEFEDDEIEDEEFEDIEYDDDLDLEDEDDEIEELDEDDFEFIDEDDDLEMEDIEIDEDDDFEEIEEDDELEEIDDDVDFIDEDDDDVEIEDIEEDDFEYVDEDENEVEEEDDFEELDDDEFEEIEEDAFDDDYDLDVVEEDEVDFLEDDEDDDFDLQEVDDEYDDLELDEDELEDFDILDDDDSDFTNISERNRIRAEKFDEYLGSLEKHYNQYESVPAGRYYVGAENPVGNELIEQRISLPDIYMGKFPITNSLFEIFVQKTGYVSTAEKIGFGKVYEGRFRKEKDLKTGKMKSIWNSTFSSKNVKGATWYQPTGPDSSLHKKRNNPVVQVSYDDCIAFAKWVGKRLPTEFEWEGSARTKKANLYPWGNSLDNKACNIETSEIADTSPVDKFENGINRYNIYDFIGNVMEWTRDETDPPYKRESDSKYYIVKGGSFISDKTICLYSRSMFQKDFTSNILGFRCVLK